jgi:hypothetical protein
MYKTINAPADSDCHNCGMATAPKGKRILCLHKVKEYGERKSTLDEVIRYQMTHKRWR